MSKPRREEIREVVPALVKWLRGHKVEVHLDQETSFTMTSAGPAFSRNEVPPDVDLVLVLGGDGTLLAAARALQGRDIPLLAVNLGSLGFLTAVTLEEMYPSLEQVLAGKHQEDLRRVLMVELRRGGETRATYHALNDIVLNKAAISRILDFEVSVDGQTVSNYKADGLILCTPTGSTGYSLAAGGPITFPAVHALIITPICSHTLNLRPLVIPDSAIVEILVHSHEESVYLTADGQVGMNVQHQDRIVCRRSPHTVRLIHPSSKSYFDVLRSKLKWGQR